MRFTPRFTVLSFAFALCGAAVPAQVQILGETATNVGVFAEEPPATAATKSIAPNVVFVGPLQVKATSGASYAEFRADVQGDRVSITVRGRASSSTSTPATAGNYRDPAARTGMSKLRFKLISAKPTLGRLVVKTRGKGTFGPFGGAVGTANVKVGNYTNYFESMMYPRVTKDFGTRATPQGTDFTVEVAGMAAAVAANIEYELVLDIRFEPGHQVTHLGDACIPVTTTFPNRGLMHLDIESTLPNANSLLILGYNTTPAFSRHMCNLFVDPIIVVPVAKKTDAQGRLLLPVAVPNVDLRILLQAIVYSPQTLGLEMTDAMSVRVVRW